MSRTPLAPQERRRIEAGLPFVESLARRMAATMPHSVDLGDLVQDGILGLIDAARRFDERRGIKFETFAERRVRGAMIDALRRSAWPRGVRRVRRELEAARQALRRELGGEPSLVDLAERLGSDASRLERTIVRIATIESTSPLTSGEITDPSTLPPVLVPSEPVSPDRLLEQRELRERVRAALAALPPRERRVIGMYYYGGATMKQIGAQIGVNESRVSQLHARAIGRLRALLGADRTSAAGSPPAPSAVVSFDAVIGELRAARSSRADRAAPGARPPAGVVLAYRAPTRHDPPGLSQPDRPRGAVRKPPAARVAAGR